MNLDWISADIDALDSVFLETPALAPARLPFLRSFLMPLQVDFALGQVAPLDVRLTVASCTSGRRLPLREPNCPSFLPKES